MANTITPVPAMGSSAARSAPGQPAAATDLFESLISSLIAAPAMVGADEAAGPETSPRKSPTAIAVDAADDGKQAAATSDIATMIHASMWFAAATAVLPSPVLPDLGTQSGKTPKSEAGIAFEIGLGSTRLDAPPASTVLQSTNTMLAELSQESTSQTISAKVDAGKSGAPITESPALPDAGAIPETEATPAALLRTRSAETSDGNARPGPTDATRVTPTRLDSAVLKQFSVVASAASGAGQDRAVLASERPGIDRTSAFGFAASPTATPPVRDASVLQAVDIDKIALLRAELPVPNVDKSTDKNTDKTSPVAKPTAGARVANAPALATRMPQESVASAGKPSREIRLAGEDATASRLGEILATKLAGNAARVPGSAPGAAPSESPAPVTQPVAFAAGTPAPPTLQSGAPDKRALTATGSPGGTEARVAPEIAGGNGGTAELSSAPVDLAGQATVAAPDVAAAEPARVVAQEQPPTSPIAGANVLVGGPRTLPQTIVQTPVPAMPLPFAGDAWNEALGQHVVWLARGDIKEARMQIEANRLGPIEVSVKIDGERVDIRFAIQHPLTHDMVQNALPRLERMLGEQGLAMGHASVGQGQGQSHGGDRAVPWRGDANAAATSLDKIHPGRRPGARTHNGLVDDFA